MRKILIIDNYDSFTYNLVQYFTELSEDSISVFKNDEIDVNEVELYDTIVISPGPGIPEEAGKLMEILEKYKFNKKILGVCLGHQAIGKCFGASLNNLDSVYHGIKEEIDILDSTDPLFKGLKDTTWVGKYHSWIVNPTKLSKDIIITSTDSAGNIMSLRHKDYPIYGVQFHPESIMTDEGYKMIKNFLSIEL